MGYFASKLGTAETQNPTSGGGYFARKYSTLPTPSVTPTQDTTKPFKANPKHGGITGWLSKTGAAIGNFVASRTPLGSKPAQDVAEGVATSSTEAYKDAVKRFQNLHDAYYNTTSNSQKFAASTSAALGIANLAFSPISGALSGAEKIPVVGKGAKAINWTFKTASELAQKYSDFVINQMPDTKTRENLRPVLNEVTGLAAQLILAKAGEAGVEKVKGTVKGTNEAIDYLNRVKTTRAIQEIPPEDLMVRRIHSDGIKPTEDVLVQKSTGNVLKTITSAAEKDQALREGFKGEPKEGQKLVTVPDKVVQVAHPDGSISILRIPEKDFALVQEKIDGTTSGVAGVKQPNGDVWHITAKSPEMMLKKPGVNDAGTVILEQIPTRIVSPEQKAVEAGVGNKTSGVAKSIEAKAIEAKLTKGFEDLAQYDSSNIKEQAKLSADLINSGIDEARAVLRGDKPLPAGLRGSSFVLSMEEYLKKNPSADIAYELANSPHVSGISQAGSELGLIQNRIQDTATQKLMEVRKAREAKIKDLPKRRSNEKKSLKKEVEKNNLTKEELNFNKFLDSIVC